MNGLTIWTAIMALAIIATAIFAGGTLWKSNKRQRFQLANLLFNEFTNRDLNIWELFSVICGENRSFKF